MAIDRRDFLKMAAASALVSLPMVTPLLAKASQARGRVVVIGGGYAGATVAKYLRVWSDGGLDVVVVEPRNQFVSCPLSNLVLGGSKNINQLTFGYDLLKKNHGIEWVSDEVLAIDAAKRVVKMKRGELAYDKLVVAPGIDFMYEQLPMLESKEAQLEVPHAWKAGAQTVTLRKQLESMKDGGVFVMSVPKAPYRCPPGPYERACQVALYLKNNQPTSKVIVLDANPEITSKKALFTKVFAENYASIIDYRANSTIVDVDVGRKTVTTEFESIQADVLNIIPPQRAGKIAQIAGTANVDKRWCEVDFVSYESKIVPNVHIIGDSVSAALPKSAHMATSQAKVCANAILAIMSQQAPDASPVFANTCYSYVSDKMAMHVANVYRYDANKKIMVPAEGGGVSEKPSELEGNYAQAWANNIWSDVLT
ncbi:NAD(P)/FAD-dependent oxidoreductase [Candidatus Methylopumilus turicensis]|uniref:Sulfide dehydrogenase [flavocytochrome c] flavoprotein chain n=1 Tax=Candidatus Methylopumilus turicensis TaxID=1581680 RepID=A0A0B7IZ38_9PROT|nr:NAD(P)/FAD-dependent oxidoreductase [Candidatus Methylopumilus turicensis]CEN55647.1 Sulfide dehydrogenase [flavocytochrome c] flavoprotein chain [Candidatus Methylopumilus turicensis]